MRFFLLGLFIVGVAFCSAARPRRELVRESAESDLFHSTRTSSSKYSPLRVGLLDRRRRSYPDADNVNSNVKEGSCSNPTVESKRQVNKADWKFKNETKLSISMSWIGNTGGESSTMLMLATSELGFLSFSPSQLYKSIDYGKTFQKINAEVFNTHIRKNYGISKSPVNPDKVILVSFNVPFFKTKSAIVKTVDGGKNWEKTVLPFQVNGPLLFHPRNEEWILALGVRNGQAFLSTDFGSKWTLLKSFVRSIKWGTRNDVKVEREEHTILLTMAVGQDPISHLLGDVHLWRSRDLGKSFEIIGRHVYAFGLQGPFMFITIDYNKNNRTRVIHVSRNGGDSFEPVMVPAVTPERFYTILDMSEGLVFLHVDEPGDTGKGVLYTSDADGVVYSVSLKDHVYTNYDAVTDFYKVKSMRGTYLASRMNQDNSVTSVITWNRGAEWQTIPLDKVLCNDLERGEQCSLQIHNSFSRSRNVPLPQGPLSEPNAVGLIIAHAHAGSALKGHMNVWLTEDGGYTWTQVLNGSHLYAISDHGNLLVAVPTNPVTVKYLMFSVNRGRCWFRYKFTEHEFHVTGLVTEPGAKTMRFSLWGSSLPSRDWQVITVDFRDVLQQACTDDDYEYWLPHEGNGKKGCLLGRKVRIRRPKKEKLCFNGADYVAQTKESYCECALEDMECDYGYYRKAGSDECVKDTTKPPDLCINGNTEILKGNLGYRRIPGDVCRGGDVKVSTYLETHQKCKNASWYDYGLAQDTPAPKAGGKSHKALVGFVVLPILILALIGVLYFGRKFWRLSQHKPTYRYSVLSQEEEDYVITDEGEGDAFDPRPKGLRTYRDYDSEDDAAMLEI